MKIKTTVEFSGVPKGTTGIAEKDGKLFKITWDLPNRSRPLIDWFSKEDYERFLVEA